MEILGGVAVFILLVVLLGPERKTRLERDMLEAFPKGQWRVYPSFESKEKWGLFEGGRMWGDYDTKEEADRMMERMTGEVER